MANQLILDRALDANGYIAPGAKATIYADGTSTLITVYSDVGGTTAAPNPIVADGNGYWPQRYVAEDAKAVVTDADGVALYTLDPVPTAQGTGAAASSISFSPTIDLPQINVQDAIEAAADLAVSGFATFGIGITGNATLLADLDVTGTGAGIYRFAGTTAGTFPTGVAAADTGMVELWRQAGATAMMELHHATSNRVFRRRLTSTVWGAWREVINVNQATAEGDIAYRGASDWARLPKGTAAQTLRMNAAATAPEWQTGSKVLLATKAASASATLDFTEFNNAVYRNYEFEFENVKPATDSVGLQMLFSTDGGSTYDAGASNYNWAVAGQTSSGAVGTSSLGDTSIALTFGMGNGAGERGATGSITLYYAGQSVQARVVGLLGIDGGIDNITIQHVAGRRLADQDTTAVRFLMASGNITSGTIRMYGVT